MPEIKMCGTDSFRIKHLAIKNKSGVLSKQSYYDPFIGTN